MARHRRRRYREPTGPEALAGVARRGATLSGLTLLLVQGISLGSTLVLARLLTPEEVGLYAAGTVLSGFLVMFAEGGLKNALVQRQTDVEDAADTVFYATVATGTLMSLLALAAAPVIAWLFDNPAAGTIAAVTSGMLLLHALTNVPDGLMIRRFDFRRRVIVDPARAVAFGAVTIVFAALGHGVWSLVFGNYASLAVWVAGTWLLARWRPGLGYASRTLWRELARFGYPILGNALAYRVREAVQTTLMGRVLGEGALGQYRYGRRLGELPGLAVVQVGSFVILPAFSRMAGEPERFRRGFFRALRWIWFAAVPLTGLLIALGQPAVVVLLGERWSEAGLLLMALSALGAAIALQEVGGEAIKGAGRSQRLNWVSVSELVVGIGLLVALLPFGLLGVGLAISGLQLFLAAVTLGLARRVVGFSTGELVRALLPAAGAAAVATAVVGPLEWFVARSAEHGTAVGLLLLTGLTLAFALVYLMALRVFDRTLLDELLAGLRGLLARRRGRAEPPEDTPRPDGPQGPPAPPGATERTTPLDARRPTGGPGR